MYNLIINIPHVTLLRILLEVCYNIIKYQICSLIDKAA